MFFAIDLLIPQHGGKFALAWLAATRGIGHISKKEIVNCNIETLCDEILKMVQSSATRPRLRLSLSLASRLINGTCKIYKAKAEVFMDELMVFLTMVRKPIEVLVNQEESDDTPLTPITRPQRKRKRKTIELSDEPVGLAKDALDDLTTIQVQVDEIALTAPLARQVNTDLITLQEDLPIPSREHMEVDEEQLLVQDVVPSSLKMSVDTILETSTTGEARAREAVTPAQIPIVEETLHSKIQSVSNVPTQSEIQPPLVELSLEVLPQPEIQVVPQSTIEEVVEMPRGESQIVPQVIEPATDKNVPEPPIRARKPKLVDKLIYKPVSRHRGAINRYDGHDTKIFNVAELINQIPVHLVKARSDNLYNLIDHSMMRAQTDEDFLREMPLSAKSRESLLRSSALFDSRLPSHGTLVPPERTTTPILPQPEHQIITLAEVHVSATAAQPESMQLREISEPQFLPTIMERLETIETEILPLAEEQITIHPPEHTIEIEMPPAAEIEQRKETVIRSPTETATRTMPTRDRQKRLRDIIKKWNPEIQDITLEAICIKPVNRKNIAMAFNDLLSLHQKGYVKLHNKPGSIELGLIERGERLKVK